MKHVFRLVFIVVAIQFASFNHVNAQINLIYNPGFEDGLTSWWPYGINQATIDSTGGYTGAKLLVLNTMVSADGAAVGQYGVPCKEGNYTFSVWIKGDSTFIGVVLDGLDADGFEFPSRWVGGSDSETKGNPDTWEKVSYTFDVVANAGETGLNVRLFIKSNKKNVGSKVLIDDASLIRNSVAPPIDPNNLIVNPGFEAGLAPWEAYAGFNDGSHVSIDSTGGYTGAKLLVITTPPAFASGESGSGVGQNDIPCVEGNYTYSAMMMGDSTYLGVILKGLDSDGFEFIRWVGGSDPYAKKNPDNWEKVTYTCDIVSDAGDTNLNLRLFIYSIKQGSGSVVLVDDASLIRNYATGITKFSNESIKLYPNPVVDKLNISLVSANSQVSIYTAAGKLISKNIFPNTTGTIDVSGFAKGVYIVKVNNKYVQKFVK